MIREALGDALSRGGDYADLFFQHRVANNYVLEDGAVNRAFTSVELGVGVRVVKGDQTGYGFTEDLTLEGVEAAAQTAAAIADGPAQAGPAAVPRRARPALALSRQACAGRTCGRRRSCRSSPASTSGPSRPTRRVKKVNITFARRGERRS